MTVAELVHQLARVPGHLSVRILAPKLSDQTQGIVSEIDVAQVEERGAENWMAVFPTEEVQKVDLDDIRTMPPHYERT